MGFYLNLSFELRNVKRLESFWPEMSLGKSRTRKRSLETLELPAQREGGLEAPSDRSLATRGK